MANYTHMIKTQNAPTPTGNPTLVLIDNIIPLADAKGDDTAGGYKSAATLDVLQIPAGAIPIRAGIFCLKAEGSTLTADLISNGLEGGSEDTILATVNLNSAHTGSVSAIADQVPGRFITAGTYRLVLNNAAATAMAYVWIECAWSPDVRLRTATASLTI